MAFSRWVFRIAGIYGLLVLTPFYFLEDRVGLDDPPAITHPEFFYGFVGVALAWQVAFLIISLDPVRYRLLMIAAIVEKVSFAIAAPLLFAAGRVSAMVLVGSSLDAMWAVLFATAFWLTRGVQER